MPKEKELNFEETLQNLENIVKELEKGELNLDDSMEKFEKGMNLSKKASKYLEDAEKKITLLIEKSDGTVNEENF